MDINKFITENLDDILNNADDYISKPQSVINKKKQVTWKEEIEDMENKDEQYIAWIKKPNERF